jgi:hypothetical protein
MSDADTPRETNLLPEAIHHAVKPGQLCCGDDTYL